MPNFKHVVFFDFDKTLVDCNSANLWFVNELRARRVPLTYGLRLPIWTLQYRLGFRNIEHMFDGAFASVAGQSEAEMVERVRVWYESQVRPHARPGALAALRAHRAAGDWLVSP
jgi:phosphoserine phosphatase